MRKFTLGVCSTALLLSVIPVTGVAMDSNVYIGGQGSFIRADDRLEGRAGTVDESGSFGLNGYLGIPLRPNVSLELNLFVNDIDANDGYRNDIIEIGTNADLVYQWGDRESFTPYILGGLGVVENKTGAVTRDNHTSGYANLGVGAVGIPFRAKNKYGIRLRGEARVAHNTLSGGQNDLQVRMGLEIPLGRTMTKTVEVEKVVFKEVPAKPMKNEPAPMQPVTDADGDGVVDQQDACANTLAGAVVDKQGCAFGLREIKGVTFLTDSDHLTPNAKQVLDNVARALRGQPDIKVSIMGHTDDVGLDAYNQKLSEKRAIAVQSYLQSRGVNTSRMRLGAFGETKPVADNSSSEGRELNRRVELRIAL